MPNRSIAKATWVDRALGSQPGGREIKLQYNIFTNIMTRMLSNVKKIYSLLNNSTTSLRSLCFGAAKRFSSCAG